MKRLISNIYNRIALISPYVEVFLRQLYWRNSSRFKKIKPDKNIIPSNQNSKIDFNKIIDYLKESGLGQGSLLIVHSSYEALEGSGLYPEEIVEELLKLVGKNGTLAMPVIRKFKGEPKYNEILNTSVEDLECVYDVKKSRITTGLLPYYLMRHDDSVVSRFPLNPMVAVGPLAKEMMKHNLDGELPSAHGVNSSWKFCVDHNAIVIGLGVDLIHYLTIMHVAEEAYENWPVKNWYRKRKFTIIDGDYRTQKTVLEREPKWGMLHLAEKKFGNDLIKRRILKNNIIENTQVGIVNSKELINFLNSKKDKAYPYYLTKLAK
jgi:aminoglycoside N3'-acetyltransferase